MHPFVWAPTCQLSCPYAQKPTSCLSLAGRKQSQGLKQNKKAVTVPGPEKGNVKFYLPLSPGQKRFKRTGSSKNSHPSLASASLPRIPTLGSRASGCKVENVTLLSTEFSKVFH